MRTKPSVFFAIGAVAFMSTGALARDGIVLSQDKHLVITTPRASGKVTPNFVHGSMASVIYSNLATRYPNGLYFSGAGDTLCGPSCEIDFPEIVAAGFKPAASATAMKVAAAVGTIAGTASITLAIYSDDNGIPGTVLWSGVAKTLPTFGVCCDLATVRIRGGLALTGGTPYWLVALTDKKEATTFAAWSKATPNQTTQAELSFNYSGEGWMSSETPVPPAFAIYSK